uniref:CSON011451 protein n=1 Tax=Culicoides sonorensis TaxID=179676 RepID=A0A336LKE7_CULSO
MIWHVFIAVAFFVPFGESARATDLIFRKTTTTTTEDPIILEKDGNDTTTDSLENEETSKTNLTGIPQIDYIYDPNLPRELNGYNLSTYPFLDSVPIEEDIEFTCDGLHDGFYASVKFNCQLYHHCLYGVRYDFLCANFTSFDQKTFICHFASEVDCKNSPRYFYSEAPITSTTTTTTTTTPEPPKVSPKYNENSNIQQNRPFARPYRRRPPIVEDYYDDYYYDDVELPLRYRRPILRDEVNDYENPRRYRLRKAHGNQRNVYQADRRPFIYDDDEEIQVTKKSKQNSSTLKHRQIQQSSTERGNDQKPIKNDRPYISGSNSKFNKYKPKLNGRSQETQSRTSAYNNKQSVKGTDNSDLNDEDYVELYDDVNEELAEYSQEPTLIVSEKRPSAFIREKGYSPRNKNKQN